MRNLLVPGGFRAVVKAGTLALVVAAPTFASEPTSVGFVDRDTIGWRNPLRAGSASTSEVEPTNSLRQTVMPVSYEEEAGGARSQPANGVKLRPHTENGGIFSGVFGGGQDQASGSQPRPIVSQSQPKQGGANQLQFQSVKTKAPTVSQASQPAFQYMPSFKSSAARRPSPPQTSGPAFQRPSSNQAAAQTANRPALSPNAAGQSSASNSRAGSMPPAASHAAATSQRTAPAAPRTTPGPSQRTDNRVWHQPTYGSAAAAAQGYQPQSTPPAGARPQTAVRPSPNMQPRPTNTPLSRPSLESNPHASVSGELPPDPAAPASPAGVLTQAHQLASTAKTEAEFSTILALCQKVPAREATAEETAFGRQLAAWALNRRGQLKARGGNNDAAMADFQQAVRIDGKCWRAIHNRGVLLAQAGEFEPAFDDFHRTIGLQPNFAKAYANRGALYVLAGELEPALTDYQQALELDPNFAIAERGCGRVCHMLGHIDEAVEHLSRAIELAPRDANSLASRGDLLTDLGEYAAAAHDYEAALAINPKYADAYRGSAWLLATCPDGEVRNPGVALERAERAASLDRNGDATTFDTLAAAQASMGDFQAAAASIQKAIELAPPSERSVYQDRLQLYRQSKPYRIEPAQLVQQAGYER